MEQILIVSNYYPPEKGAAANRIEQLALQLKARNFDVSVLCPLANYPEGKLLDGYRGRFSKTENLQGITVKRLWIFPSNSKNIAKRILSILSFSTLLFLRLLFGRLPKKVIVQSPPLLLSFLAVLALKIRRRKIILNVSDLWPMAALELGVMKADSFPHKFALSLEKFIYKNATVILGQSEEIIEHVHRIVFAKKCFLYRNFPVHGEAFEFTDGGPRIKLFYAGLLGVAQGVLECCKQMKLDGLDIDFHIFGDGAEKEEIRKYIADNPQKNITFHGMVDRKVLHKTLESFDLAFVPLATRIYGSVPSKIFEYGALGMPILYFGGGEGGDLTNRYNLGYVAEVGDFDALNDQLKRISENGKPALENLKKKVKASATEHFSLQRQMDELLENAAF